MNTVILLAWMVLGSIMDIRRKSEPVWWICLGMLAALTVHGVRIWTNDDLPVGIFLIEGLLLLIPGLIFLILSRGGFGIGLADAWFLMIVGLWEGDYSAYACMVYGTFLAAVVSVGGLTCGKLKRSSSLPFIPFLCIGWIFGKCF